MIRGFYTAGSGMISQSRKLDVSGANMSNARTSGYKRSEVTTASFNEKLLMRYQGASLPAEVGSLSPGTMIDSVSSIVEQGGVVETGNPFNLAIEGEGFFTLRQADGTIGYTRNGEFLLDSQGYITDANGNRLMGENGPLNTGGKQFEVSSEGVVLVDGEEIGKLSIYTPVNAGGMAKQESGLFTDASGAGQKAFAGQIVQGSLETSNVDLMEEMMSIMSSQRNFQACSQVAKMIDSTIAKTVEIGRLG